MGCGNSAEKEAIKATVERARSWELLHSLDGHSSHVLSATVLQDRSTIASGSKDNTIKLWNSQTGQLIGTMDGPHDTSCLAVLGDGVTLASGSPDYKISLWNTGSRSLKSSWLAHSNEVTCLALLQDGLTLASGSRDFTVKMWDSAKGMLKSTFMGHVRTVWCLCVLRGTTSSVCSGSEDETIKVWDSRTKQLQHTLTGHDGAVLCMSLLPDGKQLLSGGADNSVKVWDLVHGRLIMSLAGHDAPVTGVYGLGDNKHGVSFVSCSKDGTVRVWDSRKKFEGMQVGGTKLLLLGRDQMLCELSSPDDNKPVLCMSGFGPHGWKVVCGGQDGSLRLWNCTPLPIQKAQNEAEETTVAVAEEPAPEPEEPAAAQPAAEPAVEPAAEPFSPTHQETAPKEAAEQTTEPAAGEN